MAADGWPHKRRPSPCRAAHPGSVGPASAVLPGASSATLLGFPEDTYLGLAGHLDVVSLCRLEASCRLLRTAHASPEGPWYLSGLRDFYSVELATGSGPKTFDRGDLQGAAIAAAEDGEAARPGAGGCVDWKARYRHFYEEASKLDTSCSESVVGCQCRLRMDRLESSPGVGVYVEVATLEGVDSLLFGVRGGREGISTLLFAPEQGLVQEMWLVPGDSPAGFKRIRTRFSQPLPAAPFGQCFCGKVGLYLCDGRIAFFRRWGEKPMGDTDLEAGGGEPLQDIDLDLEAGGDRAVEEDADVEAAGVPPLSARQRVQACVPGSWQTTGFIQGPCWASGQRLSIYLGSPVGQVGHRLRIARVGVAPPVWPIGPSGA